MIAAEAHRQSASQMLDGAPGPAWDHADVGYSDDAPLPSAFDIAEARAQLEADPRWSTYPPEFLHEKAFDAASERLARAISLAAALDDVVAHLHRFVYLPRATQYDAIALWVAHTHAIHACEYSPILNITSAVMRSGKSRLFEAIEPVVARPWKAIQPSEPVLFRTIDDRRPTLLLDEADTIFTHGANKRGETDPVRAILNAGNRRGTRVPRMMPSGKKWEPVEFDVFCAKAVAGIGSLPATVVDRAIVVVMERKRPEDRVERLRLRDIAAIGRPLHDALEGILASVGELRQDDLPEELDDRAQDGWEPLLAIAGMAGRDWPARALTAAIDLSSARAEEADEDQALLLLADAREAFGDDDAVASSQLAERLCGSPDAPWGTWRGDKGITPRGVSVLLRRFHVKPRRDRGSSKWHRVDFADAWSRYLDPSAGSATSATTPGPVLAGPIADGVAEDPPQVRRGVGEASPRKSSAPSVHVADVADAAVAAAPPTCGCGRTKVQTPDGRFVCTNAPAHVRQSTSIRCVDYTSHQFEHRMVDGSWVCSACQAIA